MVASESGSSSSAPLTIAALRTVSSSSASVIFEARDAGRAGPASPAAAIPDELPGPGAGSTLEESVDRHLVAVAPEAVHERHEERLGRRVESVDHQGHPGHQATPSRRTGSGRR